MPDMSEYYFQKAIDIFEIFFQNKKDSLERPLINLLKIYSLNQDTVMEQHTQNRLYTISALFKSLNKYPEDSTITEYRTFSPEEDSARDLMEQGISI